MIWMQSKGWHSSDAVILSYMCPPFSRSKSNDPLLLFPVLCVADASQWWGTLLCHSVWHVLLQVKAMTPICLCHLIPRTPVILPTFKWSWSFQFYFYLIPTSDVTSRQGKMPKPKPWKTVAWLTMPTVKARGKIAGGNFQLARSCYAVVCSDFPTARCKATYCPLAVFQGLKQPVPVSISTCHPMPTSIVTCHPTHRQQSAATFSSQKVWGSLRSTREATSKPQTSRYWCVACTRSTHCQQSPSPTQGGLILYRSY